MRCARATNMKKMRLESWSIRSLRCFLPLYKARHRWKDRIKEVSVPLFPGYVFVREELKRWLAILTTPGVSSIVSCGDQPAAIPFSEIEGIRRVVETTLRVETPSFFKIRRLGQGQVWPYCRGGRYIAPPKERCSIGSLRGDAGEIRGCRG